MSALKSEFGKVRQDAADPRSRQDEKSLRGILPNDGNDAGLNRRAVPPEVRRRLRIGLGSRTQRRAGTKNRYPMQPLPKVQLRKAIETWLKEQA